MDDLAKKKGVRGGHRASASKLVAKIIEAIPKASPESPEKDLSEAIAELERTLLQLDDPLGKLGGQSLPLLTPTILTSAEGNLDQSHVSISSAGKIIRAKLTKLRLRNFGGKICEWPEFWNGFSSSIDNNDQLSDVDKFAYLHRYLEGPAKSTIAGLSLTGANYKCAVELLKKRFKKKSAVQRAHVNELIQLPAVYKERDTQRLRKLYDSCEANNCALKALGVNKDSYSAIVVPTIMEKLPEQFRLTITRGQNFLEWSMEEMLNAFEKELELCEAHNAVGTNSDREQERHERNSGNIKKYGQHHHETAAALLANERRGTVYSV
ncbi:E3 ubiquitin- ligase DZIP3 [Paramuricea clavata]|uniref:E3 ubiquitin- ligase DZIP3 n=1 Tax=Paramuricea clavata TaxID=317549 RepID=A0A7D9IKL6_PARCT|nr:E3 ubiquitin- ligase DZIP3 [Paramuricea clavata]